MSENTNDQNVVTNTKKTPELLNKKNRGTFAAILISGVIIASFVVYYSILGQESRKKNSLQLIVAVSKIHNTI